MKRVLITGASGFIGRHAIAPLLELGYEVCAADIRPLPDAPTGVVQHEVDLTDITQIEPFVKNVRPTHLLHFAWHVPPKKFWNALENVRWVQISLDLLLAFAKYGGRRCVSAGTCAEYDWSGDGFCQEDNTPLKPSTLYGGCKSALFLMQTQIARETGLSSAWGRVFHLYGPHEAPGRLVPSVIQALLQRQPAPCTHGKQIRDFIYVGDLGRAFSVLLDSELEDAVNMASGTPVSVGEVVERIAEIIGCPELVQISALESPSTEPARLVGSSAKLRSIGFVPQYGLEEGLRSTIEWYRHSAHSGAQESLRRLW